MTKAEGIYGCQVLSGKAGEVDGVMNVQINVQITDGPDKGKRCTYEDTVNARSAKYIGWSCTAVGWKGQSLLTLESDVNEWVAKTGGASTVEIKHIEVKKGKAYDKWYDGGCQGPAPVWDKVAGIGRGQPRPLKQPSADTLKDADEAMREAMGEGTPPAYDDAPAGDPNDIPFLSCSPTATLGEIAAVLK